jgi:hypothetical protein
MLAAASSLELVVKNGKHGPRSEAEKKERLT